MVECCLRLYSSVEYLYSSVEYWIHKRSGVGQVVDAAMVDGAATLMAMFFSMKYAGALRMNGELTYWMGGHISTISVISSDGKYVSVGSIEPLFYALLLENAGRTQPAVDHGPRRTGADSESVLRDLGFTDDEIELLVEAGVVGV